MRIVMVGTGYVGLVSGVCFSDFGHTVVCVDKSLSKIQTLNDGGLPIFEPGLKELVRNNVKSKRLSFTTDLAIAMRDADAVFIGVGTPSRRGDGYADLSYVYSAAEEIGETIANGDAGFTVIITKSTVPVGTGDEIEKIIKKYIPSEKFAVVSNPEFLREGAAINDFKKPDRVVVGTENEKAKEIIRSVYRPLFINETPILFTNRRTAELIKYASNAFLATKITFINEIADLCDVVGANVQEVARGIGLDKRIGGEFLHAGPGYGGSCFPKDTLALTRTANEAGAPVTIVQAVIDANNKRKMSMANKIINTLETYKNGNSVAGKTIAVLGLAFKPNTDDMRDAPSLTIIPRLIAAGMKINAYDPEAMQEAKQLLSGVEYFDDAYACLDGADAVVIITEWDEFRALDIVRVKALLNVPILIDLRNIYVPETMSSHGFTYANIGRPV